MRIYGNFDLMSSLCVILFPETKISSYELPNDGADMAVFGSSVVLKRKFVRLNK